MASPYTVRVFFNVSQVDYLAHTIRVSALSDAFDLSSMAQNIGVNVSYIYQPRIEGIDYT